MKTSAKFNEVKNLLYPTTLKDTTELINRPGSKDPIKNVGQTVIPIPVTRLKQDIKSWRMAIEEIERAVIPFRVRMQYLYLDTVVTAQVKACMDRRKELTMLRDFKICDQKGIASDDLKAIFRNSSFGIGSNEQATHWFDTFLSYALDSLAYGYSLISLGDLENSGFPNITSQKRWLVSPDRFVFVTSPYMTAGTKFKEHPYQDWHVYVPTPSQHGISACGYGYLFEVAPSEIFLRNNIGYNADFNEVFNFPMVKGSTIKTEEQEREAFAKALSTAGAMRWMLIDNDKDTVDFIESKNVGSAHQSFTSFTDLMSKNISKIILGHEDAMASTPGKLGPASTKKGITPVDQAMAGKQTVDGIMCQNVINSMLFPRLRKMGFKIPLNYHYEFMNDSEEQDQKNNEIDLISKYADASLKFFQAGKIMDSKYITDQTNVPLTDVPVQAAPEPKPL